MQEFFKIMFTRYGNYCKFYKFIAFSIKHLYISLKNCPQVANIRQSNTKNENIQQAIFNFFTNIFKGT